MAFVLILPKLCELRLGLPAAISSAPSLFFLKRGMDQKIFEIDGKNALIGTRECMALNLANRQRDTVSDVFIEGMVGDSHIKVMGVVVVPFRG